MQQAANGPRVDALIAAGVTPLHEAAKHGQVRIKQISTFTEEKIYEFEINQNSHNKHH